MKTLLDRGAAMRTQLSQLNRLAAVAVTCACMIVTLAACGGGAGGAGKHSGGSSSSAGSNPSAGGKNGHTLDLAQYQADVGNGDLPGIGWAPLEAYDPANGDQLGPSDCSAAQTDLTRLQSDTAGWPAVFQQPMDDVEKDEQTAINSCMSGDFTAMMAAIKQADDGITAAQNVFAAHCTDTGDLLTRSC